MSGETDIRKNGSGYRDDTAYKAICNVTREKRNAKRHSSIGIQALRPEHNRNSDSVVDKCNDHADSFLDREIDR